MDYNKSIDQKWQKYWLENRLFNMAVDKDMPNKYYCLVMFPYPSSELHVGHARNYVIGDAVGRYKRMMGLNVLSPMGWDAFGLPAENQAIKHKIHPETWTLKNIKRIKEQLASWGIGYDWDREITACLPDYYRWTQWVFLQLYKKGLAYRKEAFVNWCEGCQTVLANEQVVNGGCERCQTKVIQRKLRQWFFKTTAYAQALLDDIKLLENWPERVKTMQTNWIGRSEGTEIIFGVDGSDIKLKCFTTRIDTIFGATFLGLSYDYSLLPELIKNLPNKKEIEAFIEKVKNQSLSAKLVDSFEKEGMFTGLYAVNPFTGKKIPIWIANYILPGYGTGAIMCVPAHDGRDYEFAKKYNLPIIEVIKPNTEEPRAQSQELFEDEGILVNSGEFTGLASRQAYEKMNVFLEQKNIGKAAVNFKLRDWLISRQRYWGAPIPMIYCDKCGEVPVPEADLPVHLPKNVEFLPTGQSPLTYVEEFKNTTCPKCKGKARRETDTMDTFVDSSWYYLRYISPKNDKIAFVKEDVNRWLPVDQYIGGVEHAILHLLYSRFINKVFYDLGLVGFKEPFAKLFTQGMIVKDGTKMSKSRGNVVAPDYIIDKYGADAMRLYILFIGPPEKEAEWQDEGLQGTARFIQRIMRLVDTLGEYRDSDKTSDLNAIEKDLRRKIHSTIKEVTDDLEGNFQFNTAISRIMELVNQIYKGMQEGALRKSIYRQAVDTVFLLLSPFTPHLSEEVNSIMGNKGSILKRVWPKYDPAYLQADEFEIAVMVNGKVRDKLVVASGAAQAEIEKKVVELEKVIKFLEGKQPKKIIYIVNKMVNIVV
jgi:leucyl-tRNA synthetase